MLEYRKNQQKKAGMLAEIHIWFPPVTVTEPFAWLRPMDVRGELVT